MRDAHCRHKAINLENEKKMKNSHSRSWNMARNIEMWKMRNTHCRTLNMSMNQKRGKGDTHVVGHGIWQETLKNVDNEKWPN